MQGRSWGAAVSFDQRPHDDDLVVAPAELLLDLGQRGSVALGQLVVHLALLLDHASEDVGQAGAGTKR